jgi:hypothetical protein
MLSAQEDTKVTRLLMKINPAPLQSPDKTKKINPGAVHAAATLANRALPASQAV